MAKKETKKTINATANDVIMEDENMNANTGIVNDGEVTYQVPAEVVSAGNDLMSSGGEMTSPLIEALKNSANFLFSSIVMDGSRETGIKVYNALLGESTRLSSKLGEPIEVEHILAHPVQLVNDETGEIQDKLRIVFVSPDGSRYHSVGEGIYSSVQKIFPLIGKPPFNPALKIIPRQIETQNKRRTVIITLG